jgi:hypothetical protein
MTNENRVIELLHAFNSPLSNAILWERIVRIAEITKEGAKSNPEEFTNPFFVAKTYIQWAEMVEGIAKQTEPVASVKYYLFMHDDAYSIYEGYDEHEEYLNLSDCLTAMDESSAPFEIIVHNEGVDLSPQLLEKAMMYTQYIILSDNEVTELKKEGHIS